MTASSHLYTTPERSLIAPEPAEDSVTQAEIEVTAFALEELSKGNDWLSALCDSIEEKCYQPLREPNTFEGTVAARARRADLLLLRDAIDRKDHAAIGAMVCDWFREHWIDKAREELS